MKLCVWARRRRGEGKELTIDVAALCGLLSEPRWAKTWCWGVLADCFPMKPIFYGL